MSYYGIRQNETREILKLIVSPIAVSTLLITLYNTISRGTFLREYKFLQLLSLMIFINVGQASFFFWKNDLFTNNFHYYFIEMISCSMQLQSLITWLFVWQYFDAVTSMITTPMSKKLKIALYLLFIVGVLLVLGGYFALVTASYNYNHRTYEQRIDQYHLHSLEMTSLYSIEIDAAVNFISIGIMIVKIWQITRLVI